MNYRIHYRKAGETEDTTFAVTIPPPYPTINFGTTETLRVRLLGGGFGVAYNEGVYNQGSYGGTEAHTKYQDLSAYQFTGSTSLTQGGIVSYSDPVNASDPVDSNVIRLEPTVPNQNLPDFWAIVEETSDLTQMLSNAQIELTLRPIATADDYSSRTALEADRKI